MHQSKIMIKNQAEKGKCRNKTARAHTISVRDERITDARHTHTHEEHATKGESKKYTSTCTSNSCCVSVAICRKADRLRRARGSLVLVGWLHQSCIIAASRMLGSHGATPRWPDRSGRRARPGLARTPAAGSGSSGERPRRTRTPHRRTWCSQRCSPRP